MKSEESNWSLEIGPSRNIFRLPWSEIWRYRDLLRMFIKRDVITLYKQTILGPVWYLLQPVMTTVVYLFVFGRIAGLSTDGLPKILFYLAGITVWNYFQESFNTTSKTFKENAALFGKVYFPRIIMPMSKIASALIKFLIQFGLFLAVLVYYMVFSDAIIKPNITILLLPYYLLLMACMGLGFGLLFTSLTVKYRDLTFLIQFGVQLLMYASPVIYPLSTIPGEYSLWIILNPLTSILEGFRYAFMGTGFFDPFWLFYSTMVSILVLIVGVLIFNKTEKDFIDTV